MQDNGSRKQQDTYSLPDNSGRSRPANYNALIKQIDETYTKHRDNDNNKKYNLQKAENDLFLDDNFTKLVKRCIINLKDGELIDGFMRIEQCKLIIKNHQFFVTLLKFWKNQ